MTAPGAHRVLIVDDDRAMRQSLVELMEAAGWQALAVSRAARVAEKLVDAPVDVILSDVRMPGMSGFDLLESLDEAAPPLVLISAHGDIPMAVEAMAAGAYSFVEKPYEPRRLLTILRHAAEAHVMRATNARLSARLMRLAGLDRLLIGDTPEVVALRREVLDLAETAAPVLLRGETGTGKGLVARALHDLGPRNAGPFVVIDCPTLRPEQFEAEMFGTQGGSPGRLASAAGGTVFLDEVAALGPDLQAKLLRVLEDRAVLPQGAAAPVPVDFRVVAATNEDVDAAVAAGTFRRDFLFRLNTFCLDLPPLRMRAGDIVLLLTGFIQEFARLYETRPPELTSEDIAALLAYPWPGNVRELRSVAERRVLAARRGGGSMAQALRVDPSSEDVPPTLREAVAAFERELIGKAITAHSGRMEAVAEALGIGRRTLNEKIVKLGLDKDALL